MKIAFVVRAYGKYGGICRCVVALAERLTKEHEVHVFTASWDDNENKEIRFHKIPMLSFDCLKKKKMFALNNMFEVASFAVSSYFMVKRDMFDIIHSHGHYVGAMDIFTVHSCHKAWITTAKKKADGWINKLKKSWVNPLHALLVGIEGYSLRVSRKVVAISRLMEKEVVEYHGVEPSKVACIYNGIEITEFSIDNKVKYRNEIRHGLGIADNAFVVIFPAHEFRRKGLEEVIKAAAKLGRKDIVILVVGRDDPAPFVAIAEKSGIKKNVIYAGMVSDIQKYYAASDAMVFPTDYEPFGLVILEAMATGLPVITSRQAGAAELMIDGRNGLLLDDPRNIDDIAEKIKTLYEDRTYCENLGGEARKTAEKYSWDVITGETLKLYSKVVGARKA